jgi:cbb3-type cytochrome oxidase maturation protein
MWYDNAIPLELSTVNVLFFAIPIALFISLIAVITFVYLVKSGQFDDLETPPRRILFDDVEGSHSQAIARHPVDNPQHQGDRK